MPIKQIPDFGWEAPVTNKATPTGNSDNQSSKSPPITKATDTPMPTGDSNSQSTKSPPLVKTKKSPALEQMPQRKAPLRCSERIRKKMDTINEIVDEEVEVLETPVQGNVKLNIFRLAVTTSIAAACAVAVKTLEMQVV